MIEIILAEMACERKRGSTTRQSQAPTIAHPLAHLHTDGAAHPEWHRAEELIYRDDGYRGATRNQPE
jgi:hypothetical protein